MSDAESQESVKTQAYFTLTPAITIQGIVNYQKASGRKLYLGATAKLDEELYA
jgi:hypothetical protein